MKSIMLAAALSAASGAQAQSGSPAIPVDGIETIAAMPASGETAYAGMFDPARDAVADVDAALAAARTSGKHVLLIFGGDWCHDSMALTEAMARPRTEAMLAARYEIVRVHVPYARDERVLPLAQRFGIAEVEGTPTVLILRADGTVTNCDDAPGWRNAASRKPAAIHRALERAAPAVGS